MGATTIWERWDGMRPDSTFQTPGMNSFNHYAYGAIGDWMYRRVAGIRETSPGYKTFAIAPEPGGKLHYATGELKTPYGQIRSAWKKENGVFSLDVSIPPNTTAEVILPGAAGKKIAETKNTREKTAPVQQTSGNNISLTLGSGTYHFQYDDH
jgi:alpha-L-rhamnosidase